MISDLQMLLIIVKQKGDCSDPVEVFCNRCPVRYKCSEVVEKGISHSEGKEIRIETAIKELKNYPEEELFDLLL